MRPRITDVIDGMEVRAIPALIYVVIWPFVFIDRYDWFCHVRRAYEDTPDLCILTVIRLSTKIRLVLVCRAEQWIASSYLNLNLK